MIIFSTSRKPLFVDQEKGRHLFEVLVGDKEPDNDKQALFVESVERVFLERATAPQKYLDMYPIDSQPLPWSQRD